MAVSIIPALKEMEAEGPQIQGQPELHSYHRAANPLLCVLAGGLEFSFGFLPLPVTFSHDPFLFFWFPSSVTGFHSLRNSAKTLPACSPACHVPTVAVKASQLGFCAQNRGVGVSLIFAFTLGGVGLGVLPNWIGLTLWLNSL